MVEGLSLDDFSSKGSFINKGKASGELTWNIDLGRTPRSRKRTVRCTRLFMTAQEGYMQGRRDTAARLLGQTAGRFHRNCKGDDRWTNRTEKNTYKKWKDKRHKEHGFRLHQRIFAFQRRGLHNMLWEQIRQAKRCTGNAKTTKEIYVCRCVHLRLWFCGAESTRTTSHTKKAGISAPRYSFSNGTGKRLAS